jgi:putative NADH-flavin reductase
MLNKGIIALIIVAFICLAKAKQLNIAILGSTGSTGLELMPKALKQSHKLHLLVRDPNRLPASIRANENVSIVQGTVTSTEQIKQIVHASDVTLICVGASENKPTTVHRDAVKSVLDAMETKTGPKKIVLVTAAPVNTKSEHSWIAKQIINMMLGEIFLDHIAAMELLFASKDVEYIILEPGQTVPAKEVGYKLSEIDRTTTTTFQDLAEAMLEVAQTDKYNGKELLMEATTPVETNWELNAQARQIMLAAVKEKVVPALIKYCLPVFVVVLGYYLFKTK